MKQETGKRNRQKGEQATGRQEEGSREQGALDAGPTWLWQGKRRGRGRDTHEGAGGSLA